MCVSEDFSSGFYKTKVAVITMIMGKDKKILNSLQIAPWPGRLYLVRISMRSVLAGSVVVHIRWGHIYVATQLYNRPPVFQHQQVHSGGGDRLQHTGLYWLTMITHVKASTYTCTQQPPQKYTNILQNVTNPSISSPLWGDREEVRQGKTQGLWQIGCVVANGYDIWESNVLAWWDFFVIYLMKNQWIHRFCGSLHVLNIHWEKQAQLVKCHCIELMPPERKVKRDVTSHEFKHLDRLALQYQVRSDLVYLSRSTLWLACCHGNHALRCHSP